MEYVLIVVICFAFLLYASYRIDSNIFLEVFCKGMSGEKVVAITFDDGPDAVQTPKVLDVLQEYGAPACFFCIGNKIGGNEDLLRRMRSEGHLVGNHSFSHSNWFPLYSVRHMMDDLKACEHKLEEVLSQKVLWFRPPFGVTNPTVARAVHKLGYHIIGWNIRSLDTNGGSPESVLRRIRKKLVPGSVILLHDRMPLSELVVRQLLELLQSEGYKVVRLDELYIE